MTTTANETRTIDFALLTRVSDAMIDNPDTVELGMEFLTAIIDATSPAQRRKAADATTDRPPVFPAAVYAAYNTANGRGDRPPQNAPQGGRPMSDREIDGMPYPDVCRTVRAALGDAEFDRLMDDHGFMRWVASAPQS